MKRLLLVLLLAVGAYGQFSSTARHLAPGASLPAACSPSSGDVFFITGTGLPYYCHALNTWSNSWGGSGVTLPTTPNVLKGDNAGGAAASSLVDNGTTVTTTESFSAAGVTSNDTTHSGLSVMKGQTSGEADFGVADVAGTAIVYQMPTTNGAAGQYLRDTGAVTCATYASGAPATCHQLTWTNPVSVTRPNAALTNSTTSDQDYASVYTIAANTLVTNKTIRVTLNFQVVTGSGTTASQTNYIKLGSTKVIVAGGQIPAASLTRSQSFTFFVTGTAAAGASVSVEAGLVAVLPFGLNGAVPNTIAQPVAGIATNGTLTIVPGVTFSATSGGSESSTLLSVIIEDYT